MTNDIDIQVSTENRFFERHADEWDALVADSTANTVFLTAGWMRAWVETLGSGKRVVIVLARLKGELVAAAAFQERKGGLEFAARERSDYLDLIFSKGLTDGQFERILVKILNAARNGASKCRYFKLGHIQGGSRTLSHLPKPVSGLYPTVSLDEIAPAMEMYAAAEKLRKKSLRRHENGLKRRGELADVTYTRASDILPRLDPFFEQHIDRWRETKYPSLFLNETNREFYRKATEYLDQSGWLRFMELTLDGRMIAAHFGFFHDGRYTWYKPTFDPELARLSPGEVLLKRLIEQARAEGAAELDFTIGDEAFKSRFATKTRRVMKIHIAGSRTGYWGRQIEHFLKERRNSRLDN